MRMTDQGLVEAEWREPAQPGRPARHAYRLTAQGLALARTIIGERSLSGFKEVPV
jgi:DNA-binding PadR family transcriptional regulator